jgi:hypothetical protein
MIDSRKLCTHCIHDGPLRDWLDRAGSKGHCDFDEGHALASCVSVEAFAGQADRWFRKHYEPGQHISHFDPDSGRDKSYGVTKGQSYQEIFAEEFGLYGEVMQAVISSLPDASDRDVAQGAARFYTDACSFMLTASTRER